MGIGTLTLIRSQALNPKNWEYRIVKNFSSKQVCRIKTIGSLVEKNVGELKSICIGNVMEIVKIGEKNLANCCNLTNSPNFFTANVFYCMVIQNKWYRSFTRPFFFLSECERRKVFWLCKIG